MALDKMKVIPAANMFSKGNKGTGLGLYISNKIIGQHGGTIDVDSALGQGSQFTITIPKTSS